MKKIILGKKNHETKQEEVNKERKVSKLESKETRKEDIKKRSAYAKHYKNEDGTFTMELNSEPIHFFNQETQEYEEIDNTFTEEATNLKLVRNDFKLEFDKEMDDQKVLRLKKNNREIGLKYRGKEEKDRRCICHKSRARTRNEDRLINSIVYEEVAPNIDLEYIVSHNKVKENIVIKQKQETYKFTFELNISNYEVQLSSDSQNIELVDSKGKVEFVIPSPVMIDGNGEISHEVTYDLMEEDEGVFVLVVTADEGWINDEKRVLPVKIDPQFINVGLSGEEITQYSVIDKEINQVYSGGTIGLSQIVSQPQAKKHRHIVRVTQESFLKYDIASANITCRFSNLNSQKAIIGEYSGQISTVMDPNKFVYNSLKYTYIGQLVKTPMGKVWESPSLIDFLVDENEEKKSVATFIMDIEDPSAITPASINSLKLVIKYTTKRENPNHYLNLGKRVVAEIISTFEIGIEEINEVEDGVLTTTVDSSNRKVYQAYQVKSQIYTRDNFDSYLWNEWKKVGLCATYSNGILFLDDEM